MVCSYNVNWDGGLGWVGLQVWYCVRRMAGDEGGVDGVVVVSSYDVE